MKCPRCQQENPSRAKFCLECATPLRFPPKSDGEALNVTRRLAEALRREQEAREQQAATSEILRVISSSPSDVRPVFETILERAATLCEAQLAHLWLYEGGEQFRLGAGYGSRPDHLQWLEQGLHRIGRPFFREIGPWRVGQVLDVRDTEPYRRGEALWIRTVDHEGMRTLLGVPLVKDGRLVGSIAIYRREVRPFTDAQVALVKTFADQAVIAIENVRLFNETKEALERQTATSEILRTIAGSPTNLQPVLDALIESAAKLCDARRGVILRRDGEAYHGVAFYNASSELIDFIKRHPVTPGRHTITARVALERRTIHIADLQADPDYRYALRDVEPIRTELGVPMFRGDDIVGVIILYKVEIRPFTDKQIELVETFADQAVIAIENVRLFNETKEALERQTATNEVLRVISQSPTDVQPVLFAVAESAARLCDAIDAQVFRVHGDFLRLAASHGPLVLPSQQLRIGRGSVTGRSVVDRRTIHIHDLAAELETEFPDAKGNQTRVGHRTTLATPLIRQGIPLGAILIRRLEVKPFTVAQVELLQTFADEAVIAIENVRLFTELQASNRDLTTALDQQTATSDILRVMSSSPTDVQPVFETIVQNAVRLCGAIQGGVYRFDGKLVHAVAHEGFTAQQLEDWRRNFPRPVDGPGTINLAIRTRAVVRIDDIEADPSIMSSGIVANLRARGSRSTLAVPMMRQGDVIGAIALAHREVGAFSNAHVELLKTFADQAVIAIENVRLFTELQEKNRALTQAHAQVSESLEQQTATSDILRAISGAQTDPQPVFDAIARSAVRLCGALRCHVFRFDGAVIHIAADYNLQPAAEPYFRQAFPAPLTSEGVLSTVIRERHIVQQSNAQNDPALPARQRDMARTLGYQALIAVPMLREDTVIGAIGLSRPEPHPFSDQQVELLKTFADQAVIAIENVRLFTELQARTGELEQKSRQLEAASQHKSDFLANMSHELRTPLNAVIGFSEVLNERMFGELNDKQDEYLKDIHASGQHLLSLINDILDLSKIEAGRMELELSHFDLPAALDNALTLVRERAGRRGIALELTVDERLGQISADERKVRQVVLNLLSNAIKFTPEGGRIDVRAVSVDGNVEVSVSHTGVGIASEDQEAIFEEFKQVGTASKNVEGTGLGLALSRKFVELHGGRIWVKSEIGQGSTFTFTIPLSR